MLWTVFPAEVLFHHDSELHAREMAIVGSIRDRKEALAAPRKAHLVTRRVVTWPRPIGVKLDLADNTAAARA